jgi:hypothetical protein
VGWLVASFLLFAPHLADVLRDRTRQLLLWDTSDFVGLMIAVVVLAAIPFGVVECMRRTGRALFIRLTDALFIAALFAGVLATLCYHTTRDGYHFAPRDWEMQSVWLVIFFSIGLLWRYAESAARLGRSAALIMSPAVLLTFGTLWFKPGYAAEPAAMPESAPHATTAHVSPKSQRPVVLFVFDEWAYDRTWNAGRVRGDMPHLEALAEQSWVMHDAHSPAGLTDLAMPRILHQNTASFTVHNGDLITAASEGTSLMSRARSWGTPVDIRGFYLPYDLIAGPVRSCRSYAWMTHELGDGPWHAAASHLVMAMAHWTDPWSGFISAKLESPILDARYENMLTRLEEDFHALLAAREPGLAILHFPLPHFPYIINTEGQFSTTTRSWDRSFEPGYESNLKALDRLIGRCIATLQHTGNFDDALIMMTSDHGWRNDPHHYKAGPDRLSHVPLVVKMPRQSKGHHVAQRFELTQLGDLIEHALTTPTPVTLFTETSYSPPVSTVALQP